MYKEMFAKKLAKARKDAGYTQQQVADETNIKKSTLAGYEIGRTQPDIETLGILADFYCVSVDWIMGTGKNNSDNSTKEEKERRSVFVSARNIQKGNGNMYITLTPEQIRTIKES